MSLNRKSCAIATRSNGIVSEGLKCPGRVHPFGIIPNSAKPAGSNLTVLKRARQKAGLTQEQLSFRTGVSRPYISQLERDLKSPTVATLFLICDALNVKAADIVRRVDATRKRKACP
jgi:DNA-binding XRE family transcriptional regulator